MTTQIFTIGNFRKYIDALEEEGAKAVIVSGDLHGAAYAPSTEINRYRIPSSLHGNVLKVQNLSYVTNNSVLIMPIKDIDMLSDMTREAYEKNLKREKQ